MKRSVRWLRAGLMLAAWSVSGALHAQDTLNGAEHSHARLPPEQPAPTAEQRPLGDFLDDRGALSIPKGYSGSLDPSNYKLISKPGEAPRFDKNAVDDADRWDDQFGRSIGCDGNISALAATADGKLLVGGGFRICGNVQVNSVALWDPTTGEFSALGSGSANGVGGEVFAIAVAADGVYVGGSFSMAGGAPAQKVAFWNGTSWSPLGSGVDGSFVLALAVSGNGVYVGGIFTAAGDAPANNIAFWNGTTWSSLGSGLNGTVTALAVSGADLYVGGSFTSAGNVPDTQDVALWNSVDSTWSSLGTGMTGVAVEIRNIAVQGSRVYVVGSFTAASGVAANNAAIYDGATWSALGAGPTNGTAGIIRAIAVVGTDVYVGGEIATAGGLVVNKIARFNSAQLWSTLGSGSSNNGVACCFVNALAITGTDLFVGGFFGSAGTVEASRVGRFNMQTKTWFPLGSGVNSSVNALAVTGAGLYVGGDFTTAGGDPAGRVAVWDGASWSPLDNGVNGTVRALAVSGAGVYVGGDFTSADGVTANYVAFWNGTSWSSLGSGPANGVNGPVHALAVSGSGVYVGGEFTRAGGVDAYRVAFWNGTSWSSLGSGSANGVNGHVHALAVSGSGVYVGGAFIIAGGVDAYRVAFWNGVAWSSLGVGANSGTNGIVRSLAVDATKLYIGGEFVLVGGSTPANKVALWDGAAWSSLGIGTNANVTALAVSDFDLYLGGIFTRAGGKISLRIARYDARRETTSTATITAGVPPLPVTQARANDLITLNASVATDGFPPQLGTVSFFDTRSGSPLPIPGCSNRPLIGGVDTRTASCPIANLRVGSYQIQARYSGDVYNFVGSSDGAPLTISAPVLELTDTLASPVAGIVYTGTTLGLVPGSGALAPITFAVTAGSLPNGINLAPSGQLTGTPSAAGSFAFTVTATDSSTTSASGGPFSGSRSYQLTVARQPTTIAITGIAPATGVAGAPYQVSVTVLDGNMPSAAPATGQVSCSEDGGTIYSATVNLGATCPLTSPSPGIKQITVRYSDTANVYASSTSTQAYTVNAAQGGGTLKVASLFAFPGATVTIPISFAGASGTEAFNAEVDFSSNRLSVVSAQGANGATCVNQSGRISVAKSSTTALPTADTPYCAVTVGVVSGAVSGPIPLPVRVSTQPTAPVCVAGSGVVRRCFTQDGQVVVAAFDPRPIDGASIVIAGYASTLNQTRTVRVLNRSGDAHDLTGCTIAGAGLSYAPLVGPNPLTVAAGTTAEIVLSCQLPAVSTEVAGTFECTTNDIARPLLRYPVICKTLIDGIPLPYEQLLDIERREGEQMGSSVDRSASTGGAITVLGAPFGGVDGSGRVLMYQDSNELPGLANAIASLDALGAYKLGQAVALRADGSRLAIGAPGGGPDGVLPGRVLLFDRPAGGWAAFDPNTTSPIILEAPGLPGGATLEFGAALAYAPNGALIVGAPGSRTSVGEAGAVFIYPAGQLEALPPVTSANVFTRGRFGAALAVNDDQLVVGAPGEVSGGVRTGAAYLVTLIAGKPTPPTRIIATEPLADLDRYGSSVAISDNLLVVGAAGADKAMVFQPGVGGAGWLARGILQPPPGTEAGQRLGTSVSISSAIAINGELSAPQAIDGDASKAIAINGELAIVGAPMADASSQIVDAGKVYLYTIRPSFRGAVAPDAVLDNASAKAGDEFGRAVALREGAALVGVPKADLVVLPPPPPPSDQPSGPAPTITLEDVGRGETFVFNPVFADGFE